ncbi:MAG: hypothetical protein U1E08_06585 [Coriobacteriia bacterium]|nr:hypothetical protein [Coriobacteriia bacterium]
MDSLLIFIRKAVRFGLTLIVVAVVLNDGVRLASALSDGFSGLKAATNAALDVAAVAPSDRDTAQAAATAAAASQGVRVVAYDHQVAGSGNTLRISVNVAVETYAERTIVIAPIVGLVRGTPSEEWYTDPGAPIVLHQGKQVSYFQ